MRPQLQREEYTRRFRSAVQLLLGELKACFKQIFLIAECTAKHSVENTILRAF